MKRTMRIGTWNVRGISDKRTEITSEIKKYKLDIAVLSETKRKGRGYEDEDEYVHFWSGVDKNERARAGISVLIKKQLKNYILNYSYISERILTVTLKIYGYETVIIGVYAPIDSETKQTKDQFYEQMSDIIMTVKKHQDIILAGDLNARIKKMYDSDVVGKYAEEVQNDSGERLLEMCNQYNLTITNTYYAHKDIHRYTWERPSLQQKSIIDYIITKKTTHFQVHDSRVKRGANCGTDHHLVVAKLMYPFSTKRSNSNWKNGSPENTTNQVDDQKYKLYLLQQSSIRDLYQRRLTNELNATIPSQNIEKEHENIKSIIHKIAKETLGEVRGVSRKNRQKMWFTENVQQLVEEKNNLYRNLLSHRTEENRQKYKNKNKELRRTIKEEKNKYWEHKCKHINSYIGGSRSTEVWQTIKNMKHNISGRAFSVIHMDKWKEYYENLLIERREEFVDDEWNLDDKDKEVELICENEVRKCMKELKNARATGPGNISAELIKYGSDTLLIRLKNLFNLCIEQQKIPKEWKISYISSIFKKGNRKDPNCYRGLSVTCTLSRLWGKIILNKLRTEVGDCIGEDQSGFTPGRSCVDNLFTLQQLIEKKKTRDQEVHITFVDLKKAYDNVPRNKLLHSLKAFGVSDYLLKIVRELYQDNISYVKQGRNLSGPIHTTKGLRQGCSLSPMLFNIYIEIALRRWKRSCQGMGIPIDNAYLFNLNFADDQAILAQDAYDMEFMLRRLYAEYKMWGLEVSLEKTEYLVTNSIAQYEILIDDNVQIKQVDEFKYLGAFVDRNGIGDREMRHRIQKARNVVGALNSIWWDKNINIGTKKRIGQTMVDTVLSYGCEVWAMKEEIKRRINAVEMDYLRRSTRTSRLERVRNEDIRKKMHAEETIINRIEKKGLTWFGHVLRMEDARWPKRMFTWKPPGKNKRGRPRKSWNEGMRKALEDRQMREDMAQDRQAWRLGVGKQRDVV